MANKIFVHCKSSACKCECPNGPCEHIWDGDPSEYETQDGGFVSTATCSKCGAEAMAHDMRVF